MSDLDLFTFFIIVIMIGIVIGTMVRALSDLHIQFQFQLVESSVKDQSAMV